MSVIEAVIAEVILPCVRQLEREREQPLPLVVAQWCDSLVGPTILVAGLPGPDQVPPPSGEMRLRFRKNYGGDRYLFHAEAIYPEGFTKHAGFSGFHVEGGVDVTDDRPVRVRSTGWTVKWNDPNFRKWR